MSTIHETPGKIIMPATLYTDIDPSSYKAVFTVFHHPFNWLNPDYKSEFIQYIRTVTDIAFIGHEHQKDRCTVSDQRWNFVEFHGKELQDNYGPESAFAVFNFDKAMQGYSVLDYQWDESKNSYIRFNEESKQFHKNVSAYETVFSPNESTISWINDLGISIHHFAKDEVYLPDLYVWPELNQIDIESKHSFTERIRENVKEVVTRNNVTIIIGASSSGKTSFAKMLYSSYINGDVCCLYVDGEQIKSSENKKLNKVLEQNFCEQYDCDHLEEFRQLPKESKIIIIDDFDSISVHGERRNIILDYMAGNFGKVILFLESEIEIHSLIAANCLRSEDEIPAYEILPMGNRKRKELIQKWYCLNVDDPDSAELESKIESAETQVNTFLGNGACFIPAVPVFILGVLQNSGSITSAGFNGSKYGFLYESLILNSLSSISDEYQQTGVFNVDIGIVSSLAFYMLQSRKKYFTEDDFVSIVHHFTDIKKVDVDPNALLRRMVTAKILKDDSSNGNAYKFRYPYIFYYFTGHHLAYHLTDPDVKQSIEYMSGRLFNEDYGNIMVFVCHFANSREVIEEILLNAYSTLDSYSPFLFEKENPVFDDIQSLIDMLLSKAIGGNEDVEQNKDNRLKTMDDAGIIDGRVIDESDTIDDEVTEKEKDLAAISASLKTQNVLGQIIQNYPADINGDFKIEIIQEIHNLGMRSIQAIISTMGYLEDELVKVVLDRAVAENKNVSRDEVALAAKQLITMLIASMVRGMISNIATNLNSSILRYSVVEALSKDQSTSAELVLQELKLNFLNTPDFHELSNLADKLSKEKSNFAYCVLSSIAAHYLKYHECNYKLRDKICSLFGFSGNKTYICSRKHLTEGR